jgi:hypothetical protein
MKFFVESYISRLLNYNEIWSNISKTHNFELKILFLSIFTFVGSHVLLSSIITVVLLKSLDCKFTHTFLPWKMIRFIPYIPYVHSCMHILELNVNVYHIPMPILRLNRKNDIAWPCIYFDETSNPNLNWSYWCRTNNSKTFENKSINYCILLMCKIIN